MNLTAENLETIWIVIVVVGVASCWITQEILFRRIKKLNYEKWVAIGEPALITALLSPSMSKFGKAAKTFNYFLKGDIELDSDSRILNLKKLVKTIYLVLAFAVGVFILAVFIINPE